MHKDFCQWYRDAKLEPKNDWIDKRWEVVNEINIYEPNSNNHELDLVKFFYDPDKCKETDFYKHFIDSFLEKDRTFLTKNNNVEFQVLAGAIIIEYLENADKYNANLIALAMTTKKCKGLFTEDNLPAFQLHAEKHFQDQAENNHKYNTIYEKEITFEIDIEKDLIAPIIGEESSNTLKSAISTNNKDILYEFITFMSIKMEELSTNLKSQTSNNFILQEESNVLWWLIGGYSNDLECQVSQLSKTAACLTLGKELSDLTYILPGIYSHESILSKMLLHAKTKKQKTSIQEAVNDSTREWREKLTNFMSLDNYETIFPVLCAIKKSLECDGKEDWLPQFKKATNIDPKEEIPIEQLAAQIYQEILLNRETVLKVKK